LVYNASGERLEQISSSAAAAAPGASVVVLVTGVQPSARQLRHCLNRFSLNTVGVVLRCQAGAQLSRGKIGQATVLTIGQLDDLPPALRTVGS
jgi:hypothetical protein